MTRTVKAHTMKTLPSEMPKFAGALLPCLDAEPIPPAQPHHGRSTRQSGPAGCRQKAVNKNQLSYFYSLLLEMLLSTDKKTVSLDRKSGLFVE
jgi:hypothetical protein